MSNLRIEHISEYLLGESLLAPKNTKAYSTDTPYTYMEEP
jgi:hypothetical protein